MVVDSLLSLPKGTKDLFLLLLAQFWKCLTQNMWKLWIYNIHVKIGMSLQPQGFSGPTVNHKVLLVEITISFLPSSIKPLSNIYYILLNIVCGIFSLPWLYLLFQRMRSFLTFQLTWNYLNLLTFARLTESQHAVHIDAGLCLVMVLNKAEGLKVKPGNRGDAIARHSRPVSYIAAGGKCFFFLLETWKYLNVQLHCASVHFLTQWRCHTARSVAYCKELE